MLIVDVHAESWYSSLLLITAAKVITQHLHMIRDVQVRQVWVRNPVEVVRRVKVLGQGGALVLAVDRLDVEFEFEGSEDAVLGFETVFADLTVGHVTADFLERFTDVLYLQIDVSLQLWFIQAFDVLAEFLLLVLDLRTVLGIYFDQFTEFDQFQ